MRGGQLGLNCNEALDRVMPALPTHFSTLRQAGHLFTREDVLLYCVSAKSSIIRAWQDPIAKDGVELVLGNVFIKIK